MRWLIVIFIILDVAFQVHASPTDHKWLIYYDFIHYSILGLICLHELLVSKDYLLGFLSLYFWSVVAFTLSTFEMTREEFNNNLGKTEPLYSWSFLLLIIIAIFTINQKLKTKNKWEIKS